MERSVRDPWAVLGIAETADEASIRKAYAAQVRLYRPDSHPEEFSRVRESYEMAMAQAREARWREAEREAPAELGTTAPELAPPQVAAPDGPVPGEQVVVRAQPLADVQPGADAVAAEPGAGEEALHFDLFDAQAAVNELASTHNEHGESAAVDMFHTHLARCAKATVDARLDYEWFVLRSLLTSDMPPLGLVFEGDRQFRWSERFGDVERIFGEGGARRIAFLAESAATWVYLREYSPNPWERRLFGAPRGRLPWLGAGSLMVGARGAARNWRLRAQEGQLPSLLARLDEPTEKAIGWKAVMSSDVKLGLLLVTLLVLPATDGGPAAPIWMLGLLGVATVAVAVVLSVGARWLVRRPRLAPYANAAYWNHGWRQWALVAGVVGLLMFGLFASISEGPMLLRKSGVGALWVVGAMFVATVFWGLWKAALAVEAAFAKAVFQPMVTASVLAFRRMRAAPESGWASPTRTTLARLRAFPQAVRDHRAEAKTRKAQAKASGATRKTAKFNWWWVLWILIVLGNALTHIK